ncbi:hypothetical protein [Pleomorphovibrio marinus]|uniref:hypothetical protein n=1 Tax=Pleomorphovibrio marinus TaxID=2164132 RepID=UPI000E0C2A84|nr:hypothetical protein [Pleomorphovibrio marinus]
MNIIKNPFNTYRITYGIVSHDRTDFKDYAHIDCYRGTKKVGQILFGSSISPGNNANIDHINQINLYFPLTHFTPLLQVLKFCGSQSIALYVEMNEHKNTACMGGIATET